VDNFSPIPHRGNASSDDLQGSAYASAVIEHFVPGSDLVAVAAAVAVANHVSSEVEYS
jgi:hypothetical protein